MAGTIQHRKITAAALKLVPEFPGSRDRLAEEFCLYPDWAFTDPEKFARYCRLPSGEWFHYLPDISYAELYRYHTIDNSGYIRRARPFRNANYDAAFPGFLYLLERSTTLLKSDDKNEAMKYIGVLLHVLQDACFGVHALEGAGGCDIFFFDRLEIGDFSPAEILSRLDCSDFPDFHATPVILGANIPEAAMRLYSHYCRTARTARRRCMEILISRWNGKNEAETLCLDMYRNVVQLCANVLETVLKLAEQKAESSPIVPLTEFEPYEFPLGGYGAYRFRTLEPDCYYTPDGQSHPLVFSGASFRSGLSFGLTGEQNLLYHMPKKLFDSFSGKLLLTGEKNASAHCRIINNGTPVQEFRLDGNNTVQPLTIPTPAGEFGIRLTSTAPYGIVVLGDAQFCAGRFDSGAISNGSDGRASGGASRKSQKNEAAS